MSCPKPILSTYLFIYVYYYEIDLIVLVFQSLSVWTASLVSFFLHVMFMKEKIS